MKNIVKITLGSLLLLLVGCPEDEYPGTVLGVKNDSPSRVYIWHSRDYSEHHFPDTLLPESKPLYFNEIAPGNTVGSGPEDPDWVKIYEKLPEKKFTVFVLSKELVDNTDWETVKNNYLILKRFDIALEELKASGYTIIYTQD